MREVGTLAHTLPGGRLVAKPEHRAQAESYWNLPAGRINATARLTTPSEMWENFCKPAAEGGDISHHLGAGHQPGPDAAEPADEALDFRRTGLDGTSS